MLRAVGPTEQKRGDVEGCQYSVRRVVVRNEIDHRLIC